MKQRNYLITAKTLKIFVFSIFFVAILVKIGIAQNQAEKAEFIRWDTITECFLKFVAHPCQEEMRIFLDSLPKDYPNKEKGDNRKFLEMLESEPEFSTFCHEVWSGNELAAEAAFRLLNILEGKQLHEICIILSHLIRLNPELFLELGYLYRNSYYIKKFEYPVDFFLNYGYKQPTTRLYELEMRARAFERINEDRLAEVKDSCLRVLNSRIKVLGQCVAVKEFFENSSKSITKSNVTVRSDKKKILQAKDRFIKYPSTENSLALLELIPARTGNSSQVFISFDEEEIFLLEYESYAGNAYAAEIICRLRPYSDGYIAELYNFILGDLVRINPYVFLQVVNRYYRDMPDLLDTLFWSNMNYGQYPEAQLCTHKSKIEALKSVNESGLIGLRDICVKRLNINKENSQ